MCWQCDHPDKTIDDYLDLLREKIGAHGWAVQYVEDDRRPFAYTVGLHARGLPELLVTGLDPRQSLWLLNSFARRALIGIKARCSPQLAQRVCRAHGRGPAYRGPRDEVLVKAVHAVARQAVDDSFALQRVGPHSGGTEQLWPCHHSKTLTRRTKRPHAGVDQDEPFDLLRKALRPVCCDHAAKGHSEQTVWRFDSRVGRA